MTTSLNTECPAALNIMGQHFPCQQMTYMAAGSKNHDGWAHSNRDAEAIWVGHQDPVPGQPAWAAFERDVLMPIRGKHDVIRPEDDPDQLLLDFDIDQN